MDYLNYAGHKYLQGKASGTLAVSCPDCGLGTTLAAATYFNDTDKHTYNCARCKQVLFPVLEEHGALWAACLEIWMGGFSEQVVVMRKFGTPNGRLKESPFKELHVALAEWNLVLGYACGWVTRGQLFAHLAVTGVQDEARKSAARSNAEEVRAHAEKRRASMRESASVVTGRNTNRACAVVRDDAQSILALYIMLHEMEALSSTGNEDKDAAALQDVATRCDMLRRLVAGTMKLPAGHSRMDFVSETPALLAVGAMARLDAKIADWLAAR